MVRRFGPRGFVALTAEGMARTAYGPSHFDDVIHGILREAGAE